MRVRRLAALAAVVSILGAAWPLCAAAGERSQFTMGSRVFDVGVPTEMSAQHPLFLPVNRVRWIAEMLDRDSDPEFAVIHIYSIEDRRGTPGWPPDQSREGFAPAPDLAERWGLEGLEIYWRTETAPSTRGDLILFPKEDNAGYYLSCGYDRSDPMPIFCAAKVRYPKDDRILIRVRMYQPASALPGASQVARKGLALANCLDVTEAPHTVIFGPLRKGCEAALGIID